MGIPILSHVLLQELLVELNIQPIFTLRCVPLVMDMVSDISASRPFLI